MSETEEERKQHYLEMARIYYSQRKLWQGCGAPMTTDAELADQLQHLTQPDSWKWLREHSQQIIAALRRQSGDYVMVDRNTLGLAHTWLRAAVECKDWYWDADQHEAATEIADELKQLLTAAEASKGDK